MGGIINFSLGQLWARGAVGSALEWHSRGQGFESPRVHQILGMQADDQVIEAACDPIRGGQLTWS